VVLVSDYHWPEWRMPGGSGDGPLSGGLTALVCHACGTAQRPQGMPESRCPGACKGCFAITSRSHVCPGHIGVGRLGGVGGLCVGLPLT